jgi:DNA processing protein
MNYTDYCMWLVMVFGAGNPKIWDIIKRLENPESAYNALKSESCSFLSEKELKSVKTSHLEQCAYIFESCERQGIKVICYYDEIYPKMLENIFNPPLILFAKGDLSVLDDLCITVVGTREPSQYSMGVAEKICSDLAKVGIIIVSGFALGIDSVSHRSAVLNGGKTVAVLGCGIDVDYPKENTKSKPAIEKRGLFITEFLPGTKPIPANFPKRNRILSGLSAGTLVIEASNTSGSLITAELALEQGRDLFCIPPSDIFDKRYSGVVKFLRDGAIPVFSYLDIIYEYYTVFTHKLSSVSRNMENSEPVSESSVFSSETQENFPHRQRKSAESEKNKSDKVKTETDNIQEKSSSSVQFSDSEISDEYKNIIKILQDSVKYIDEIASVLKIPVPELYLTLTDMEIDGIIECLPGKAYRLI